MPQPQPRHRTPQSPARTPRPPWAPRTWSLQSRRPLPSPFPNGSLRTSTCSADHAVAQVNEDSGAHAVELRTHGEVLDIAEQARVAMLAAGWTENHYSPFDTRGGASIYHRKGDRSATLAMAWGGNGLVQVMYNFATVPR